MVVKGRLGSTGALTAGDGGQASNFPGAMIQDSKIAGTAQKDLGFREVLRAGERWVAGGCGKEIGRAGGIGAIFSGPETQAAGSYW